MAIYHNITHTGDIILFVIGATHDKLPPNKAVAYLWQHAIETTRFFGWTPL